MHPHDEQETLPHAAWPRDFDVRACRAEQQELLAPSPDRIQEALGAAAHHDATGLRKAF